MSITKSVYGAMPDGQIVEAYTLNNSTIKAQILTYGATLDQLWVPDRQGEAANVLLTFESLEERMALSAYQGEVVGRYANRIAGARFTLNGQEYPLTANEGGICLHGNAEFSHALWQAQVLDETHLLLRYTSAAGACGFPGRVEAQVCYALKDNSISIEYNAVSDADTVLNMTNHAYFNLAGQGDVLEHVLQMDAAHYLPTDDQSIPTGELRPVAGTAFDFTQPKPIGQDILAEEYQLTHCGGYDHNFCHPGIIRVYEPTSGRRMEVASDLPGVQFYSGNFLKERAGVPWSGKHSGFCLETQAWPDSPNQAWAEQSLLRAGESYQTTTTFTFSHL